MLLKATTDHWELNWPQPNAELAIKNGQSISLSTWLVDVVAATKWLEQQGDKALLYERDWYRFSVWFFALLNSKKRIILPANDKPATLAELASQYSFKVPSDKLPPALAPKEGGDRPLLALKGKLDSPLTFFTSGSSGQPKAVEKTLRQLWSEVIALEQTFGSELGRCSVLTTVTHQHIYGLLFTLLWPIAAARPVVLPLIDYPEQLLQTLTGEPRHRYALISSPAHLQRLDNVPQLAQHNQALTRVFSSGGPLPESVPANFACQGLTVPTEVYGSTETGGIGWRQRCPGNTESFEPLAGIDVSTDNHGLLVIQSPYLKDPASLYTTEDRVQLEAQGRFRLLGRRDRIVKIAEKRVSLSEVESFLQQHPWVESVKTCVLDNPRVELGVVLVLTPDGKAGLTCQGRFETRQQLRHHLQQRFEKVVVPKRFRYVQELPYNGAGKLTQADLQALFEEEK